MSHNNTEVVDGPLPGDVVNKEFVDTGLLKLTIEHEGEKYIETWTYSSAVKVLEDEE